MMLLNHLQLRRLRLEHDHEIRPLEQINGSVILQDCPGAVPAAHGNNFFTYSQVYDVG